MTAQIADARPGPGLPSSQWSGPLRPSYRGPAPKWRYDETPDRWVYRVIAADVRTVGRGFHRKVLLTPGLRFLAGVAGVADSRITPTAVE